MNKLIIDNRTEVSDDEALRIAREIVKEGRISTEGKGESYCALASNLVLGLDVMCWRNEHSDTIRIMYQQ